MTRVLTPMAEMLSAGPRYPGIVAFPRFVHVLVQVGRDFPFPQFRIIGSRSLNAVIMRHAWFDDGILCVVSYCHLVPPEY